MPTLSEMKARYQAASNEGDSNIWSPMNSLSIGESQKIRLLPWQNPNTGLFWAEYKFLTGHFTNPANDDEEWKVFIPSRENYANSGRCPVSDAVRSVYRQADEFENSGESAKHKSYREAGRDHWVRYKFFYQGFVGDSDEISIILLPKSLAKRLNESVLGKTSSFDSSPLGEFTQEEVAAYVKDGSVPEGFDDEQFKNSLTGYQFLVSKGKKGDFANYDASSWQHKKHELSEAQVSAIASKGFIDLLKMVPKQPTDEQYATYEAIIKKSLNFALGESTDSQWEEAWDNEGIKPYKPKSSFDSTQTPQDAPKSTQKPAPKSAAATASNPKKEATAKPAATEGESGQFNADSLRLMLKQRAVEASA